MLSYKKKMPRWIVLFLLLCFSALLHSAYINKIEVQVTQPDGTVLDLYASGDEYHNWLHDEDNFTIIAEKQTGFYCYAVKSGEGVVAGPLVVGTGDPREHGLTPGINISEASYKQIRQTRFYMPEERDAPTTGTINNIVIYIRFSDETEFGEPISTYNGWFNSNANSQKNYFLEASYGLLTVNTTFYPLPVNNYVVSWQDSNPRAYYQPYDAVTNPTGYSGDTQRRNREFTLLQNATNGVSSQIPSDLVIDSDGDGRVDNVVYIVRGAAGAWSSLLWPHRWAIYDRYVYINGKRVYDFNFQLQTFLASRSVGVICHEFFHTLGAPDLYHYTDNGISPAGTWDLMNSDTNPPQHMTAFMKYKYGDWISSIPTISADQVYTLNPLTSSTGQCYRINSQNPSQYYVVEFRKKTGTFESSIPGSGLLVYRIDTSAGNGNAQGPPDELYIYRPGGTTTVNGTPTSAHFSSETGRISINSTTNPSPFLQDGSPGNLYLCEIGSSAGSTISFRKGIPNIDFFPNPYQQSFDATTFPPNGWQSQIENGSYAFTRVTSGNYPFCLPFGLGMTRYYSYIAPAGSSALLVTPRIICSDPVGYGYQISFYMYRDSGQGAAPDKIEVYMNSTPDLAGSPVQLGTIHRSSLMEPVVASNGWYRYSFALPFDAAGDYYAILRAISGHGYNMFLDSVEIARVPLTAMNPVPVNEVNRIPIPQNLSWQSGGGNPSGYKLYLGTNNPPSNLLNGLNLGNVLSYEISPGLLSNTTYYWKIEPFNEGGAANDCSIWSFNTIPYTDLMATYLTGTGYVLDGGTLEYQLSVQNNGALTLNSYTVKLMSAEGRDELASLQVNTPLEMDATAVHTLSWTPSATGEYSIYGEVVAGGDENPSNNITANQTAYAYPVTHFIPAVGDMWTASLSHNMPFNFYWKNSVSETIYLASELQMTAGSVIGIVYINSFVEDLVSKPVKIWLKNTTESSLTTSWLPFAGYTLVFDGVVDFPAGVNEVFIPFESPFIYTGDNLAVRCNRPMDTFYFSINNKFYYNESTVFPSRSRYLYSDDITYDPTAPSALGTLSSNIPVTLFIVENAAPLVLPAPEVSISFSGGSLELNWNQHPGYFGYHIYASDNPFEWSETPTATVYEPSFTVTDAVRKFFKVVAFNYDYAFRHFRQTLSERFRPLSSVIRQPSEPSSANKD